MTIKAYKAFNSDWTCRGFQYAVGKTYEHEGEIKPCQSGFHACENPFDVLSYYGLVGSRFAEVEISGEAKAHEGDSKVVGAKITVTGEIAMPEFIGRCVGWIIDDTKGKADSGYSAQIGSSGDSAQIGSSGYSAQIDTSGENSVTASAGLNTKWRGAKGAWVSLAEYKNGECVGFATGCVGKDGIKADTWYRAEGGKLVEVAQ